MFSNVRILLLTLLLSSAAHGGDRLYNGIELPDAWPPRPEAFSNTAPEPAPYLVHPPQVIPIDVGRQLLVDDFLIEESALKRVFHQPIACESNPILSAEHYWEKRREQDFAAPFSDGVWYDPADKQYKMWYMGGVVAFFCYATSSDGVTWQKPELTDGAFKGSNRLDVQPVIRDSSVVWLDQQAEDPAQRFKMMYYRAGLQMRTSADGIHWSDSLGAPGPSGDRTTFFYNPFRKVWVYSIRAGRNLVGRCRYYGESPEFKPGLWKSVAELSRWTSADELDRVQNVEFKDRLPDLYNLDATPYESLMLGFFTIHSREAEGDRPKINHVTLGYSRDGFHWHRPDRRPFLNVSDDPQAWNYGNVQSAGGGCLIVGDRLYFYCSGRNSHREKDDGSGGATGLFFLRRDGFASLQAEDEGSLTTRPISFQGRRLFANVDCPEGALSAEILDQAGQPIQPFTRENAVPIKTDSTRVQLTWKGADDLSALVGKTVRLRFHLAQGALYSFWVSPDEQGASGGYVAAGGPQFKSNLDTSATAGK